MQDTVVSVGMLVTSSEQISPDANVRHVADRFFADKDLDAVALVEGDKPVGLITRNKLLFTLFRRFGFELYGRKPIHEIADKTPLLVNEKERVDVTLDRAMERPFQDIYDEIVVVDDGGGYIGLLSVKKIVIEQSNALANSMMQKELASAKALELEKVSKIKSQFVANVTHELKAPVNAIIGLAEMLKISCEQGYIDQIKDRLSLLFSSATSLRAIIVNILDLSKIEAGKMDVFVEEFNAAELLYEVGETARILVGKKPIEVKASVYGQNVVMETDRIKVRQILVNLVSNAAKFTDKGHILLEGWDEGGNVYLKVSDTGIGIRQEDLDRLFSAFTQLEDAKTKRYEGTGLGLTITKHLADLLGGSISVESRFGEGTVFTFRIPNKHMKMEAHHEQQEENNGNR